MLALAAAVEARSEHPLARAVLAAAAARGWRCRWRAASRAEPGLGLSATVEGRALVLGNAAAMAAAGVEMAPLAEAAARAGRRGQDPGLAGARRPAWRR